MKVHARLIAAASVLPFLITGCHGGGISPAVVDSTNGTGSKTASFTVFVPAPSAGVTTPQSIVVTLVQVNGAPPVSKTAAYTMNLTSSTKSCSALSGGALSCTATVPAPAGNDTFALTTFSGLNGTRSQIATSQAKASVSGSGTKCLPVNAAKRV